MRQSPSRPGQFRAAELAALVPWGGWQWLSCEDGSKGPRLYGWALISAAEPGTASWSAGPWPRVRKASWNWRTSAAGPSGTPRSPSSSRSPAPVGGRVLLHRGQERNRPGPLPGQVHRYRHIAPVDARACLPGRPGRRNITSPRSKGDLRPVDSVSRPPGHTPRRHSSRKPGATGSLHHHRSPPPVLPAHPHQPTAGIPPALVRLETLPASRRPQNPTRPLTQKSQLTAVILAEI